MKIRALLSIALGITSLAFADDYEARTFTAPNGVRLVRIDRKSGKRVYGAWPDDNDPKGSVIWEAFAAETEPKRTIRQDELEKRDDKPKKKEAAASTASDGAGASGQSSAQRDQEFMTKEGGIY